MNYMSHTDHAEDTKEEPNSALLLERLKEHEYRESTRIALWAVLLEYGAHGLHRGHGGGA